MVILVILVVELFLVDLPLRKKTKGTKRVQNIVGSPTAHGHTLSLMKSRVFIRYRRFRHWGHLLQVHKPNLHAKKRFLYIMIQPNNTRRFFAL
jgi:hypothetical protein